MVTNAFQDTINFVCSGRSLNLNSCITEGLNDGLVGVYTTCNNGFVPVLQKVVKFS